MRIAELDFLKGVAIICVVIGHVHLFTFPRGGYDEMCYEFIYSFHMPLFMFISGFLAIKTPPPTLTTSEFVTKGVIISKFKRLVIPCVFWQIITHVIRNDFSIHNVIDEYWYLKCLFVYVLLFNVICLFCKKDLALLICLLITFILPGCWNLCFMFPFFMLGAFFKSYNIFEMINKKYFIFLLFSCLFYFILYLFWNGEMSVDRSRFRLFRYTSTYYYDLYCLFFRTILGTSAILLFYSLSHIILKKYKMNLLKNIGQYSLEIYLTHSIFVYLFRDVYLGFGKNVNIVILSIIIVAISYLSSYMFNRIPFVGKFFMGRA